MSFKEEQQSPSTHGNLITILSIDGGGVRGIIPGVLLAFLESELQVPFILSFIDLLNVVVSYVPSILQAI